MGQAFSPAISASLFSGNPGVSENPLRPEDRERVAVRIVEVGCPERPGDGSRFVSELDSACGQRLVRRSNVLDGENDLDRARDLAARPGQRLAQAERDAAAIEESEALVLAIQR